MSYRNQNQLKLDNISISHNTRKIVFVDETIKNSEVLTIVGDQNCGKSALLAFIAGFLPNDFAATGGIFLNHANIAQLAPHKRRLGCLYRSPLLFPYLSVEGNLKVNMSKVEKNSNEIIWQALEAFKLDKVRRFGPESLSKEQKFKVALLKVLLAKPQAVLLDEPFSIFEGQRRINMKEFLFQQLTAANLPSILVTHEPADAPDSSQKLIHLCS